MDEGDYTDYFAPQNENAVYKILYLRSSSKFYKLHFSFLLAGNNLCNPLHPSEIRDLFLASILILNFNFNF
ncbi:hypothetical protein EGI32_08765 [Ferruginibacter sp. HRS2-29]|nr:hypothetical protein [Ferruginibacter sp. HRS2-29]